MCFSLCCCLNTVMSSARSINNNNNLSCSYTSTTLTSLPLSPCLRQCSMTTKNCWRGGQSESRVRPKLRADSISPLILSLAMFSKLARSMAMGSRRAAGKQTANTFKKYPWLYIFLIQKYRFRKKLYGVFYILLRTPCRVYSRLHRHCTATRNNY